ncbi:hypothetical protein ABZP36_029560 [Zizania latifolia]
MNLYPLSMALFASVFLKIQVLMTKARIQMVTGWFQLVSNNHVLYIISLCIVLMFGLMSLYNRLYQHTFKLHTPNPTSFIPVRTKKSGNYHDYISLIRLFMPV